MLDLFQRYGTRRWNIPPRAPQVRPQFVYCSQVVSIYFLWQLSPFSSLYRDIKNSFLFYQNFFMFHFIEKNIKKTFVPRIWNETKTVKKLGSHLCTWSRGVCRPSHSITLTSSKRLCPVDSTHRPRHMVASVGKSMQRVTVHCGDEPKATFKFVRYTLYLKNQGSSTLRF